ncbi:MAG: DUF1186 domain-containing protein [Syntrophobacteraceae bacterium]
MSEEKVREILEAFETIGVYKQEEVQAAIEIQDQITSYLVEIVEKVASNPSGYADKPSYFAHIYAIMLLGHFREPRSHDSIVKLAGLPGDLADKLLGDTITEHLSVILYLTCGGSLEYIKSLARKEDADDYCRKAAFDAMVFAVAAGIVPREEIVAFFSSIFDHLKATSSRSYVWSLLADAAYDLYPEELMDKIKDAYDAGRIDNWYVSYKTLEGALEGGIEDSLNKVRQELERRSLDDLHGQMKSWASFDPEAQAAVQDVEKHRPNKPKAGKAKRKMAKTSRKKNRRK